MFKCLTQPKIEKLLDQEYYHAKREVIGQQEKVHRLRIALMMAEAALTCYEEREENLEAQLREMKRKIIDSSGAPIGFAVDKTPAMGMDH